MQTFAFILLLCCVYAVTADDEKYTSKFDNINVKEVLENKRLLIAYVNCLLDKGKCSPEGKELKDHLEDALSTGCKKCTEKQEEGTTLVIEHLIKYELELWKELVAKYDPTGEYRKKYEDRAKEKGITIPE